LGVKVNPAVLMEEAVDVTTATPEVVMVVGTTAEAAAEAADEDCALANPATRAKIANGWANMLKDNVAEDEKSRRGGDRLVIRMRK
jgi:hypothetical protein